MPRSSRSVSLVLLGSTAFLAGCSRDPEREARRSLEHAEHGVANYHDQSAHQGGGHYRPPIFIPVPIGGGGGVRSNPGGGGRGSGGGGGVSSPGGTSRGGFGSMGHSAGS